jgi:hypothetical protein
MFTFRNSSRRRDVSNNKSYTTKRVKCCQRYKRRFQHINQQFINIVNDVFVGRYAGINNDNELITGSLTNEGAIVNTSTSSFTVGNGLNTGSISGTRKHQYIRDLTIPTEHWHKQTLTYLLHRLLW